MGGVLMAEGQGLVEGGIYHFLVEGALDTERLADLDGFVVAVQDNGWTRVVGPVTDQAALHDLLGWIEEAGLPLVMVGRAECPCRKRKCPRRGLCTECHEYHAVKGRLPYCLRKGTRWDKAVGVFG